jgi:hypothetical protein
LVLVRWLGHVDKGLEPVALSFRSSASTFKLCAHPDNNRAKLLPEKFYRLSYENLNRLQQHNNSTRSWQYDTSYPRTMIGAGQQPVTGCARVWMFHKSAKLKQFMQANPRAEARQRSPIRLCGCITPRPFTVRPRRTMSRGQLEKRPKSEKLQTCHI